MFEFIDRIIKAANRYTHNVQDFYQAHEMMIRPESNGQTKEAP